MFSINNLMTLVRDTHILVTDEFKVNQKRYIDVIDYVKDVYELEPIELSIIVAGKETTIKHNISYLEKLNISVDGSILEIKFEDNVAKIRTPKKNLAFINNPGLLPFVFKLEIVE